MVSQKGPQSGSSQSAFNNRHLKCRTQREYLGHMDNRFSNQSSNISKDDDPNTKSADRDPCQKRWHSFIPCDGRKEAPKGNRGRVKNYLQQESTPRQDFRPVSGQSDPRTKVPSQPHTHVPRRNVSPPPHK